MQKKIVTTLNLKQDSKKCRNIIQYKSPALLPMLTTGNAFLQDSYCVLKVKSLPMHLHDARNTLHNCIIHIIDRFC